VVPGLCALGTAPGRDGRLREPIQRFDPASRMTNGRGIENIGLQSRDAQLVSSSPSSKTTGTWEGDNGTAHNGDNSICWSAQQT
jgi:hypothetical protein